MESPAKNKQKNLTSNQLLFPLSKQKFTLMWTSVINLAANKNQLEVV